LAFLASFLEAKGHQVEILEFPFTRKQKREFSKKALLFQPNLIGIGIRNLDNSDLNAYRTYLQEPAKLVDLLRATFKVAPVPILVGGPAATVDPKRVLRATEADCLILGEGEPGLLQALEFIASKKPLPKILSHSETIPFRVIDTRNLPAPQLYRWVSMKPYLGRDAGYPLQTKRGCPLHCTYCTYARIEGSRYRLLDPDSIAREVEGALSTGIEEFEFVDSTFNLPVQHARNVLSAIQNRRVRARFIGTGLNPLNLPFTLLEQMKEVGFESTILTAESASPTMLRSYRKDFCVEQLRKAAVSLKELQIQTLFVFLIGGPLESRETVEETLEFIKEFVTKPHVAYITCGIRIYPGSPLHGDLLCGKLDPMSLSWFGTNRDIPFYLSHEVGREWLNHRLQTFRRTCPNTLCSDQGQGYLADLAQAFLEKLPVKKPIWRFARLLNRLQDPFFWKNQRTIS
jgi:radical SAM superfamily enzyme YgiQ (UPF0313 family)